MKHLTYGERSWLLDDESTGLLMEYAIQLARTAHAAAIEMNVLDANGNKEQVTFLMGPATMMTAESSHSTFDEPDNAVAISDLRARLDLFTRPPSPVASDLPAAPSFLDDL